jgi:ABC-type bacteriocin/lantibiotic exporter with double-glycine peptidase domain
MALISQPEMSSAAAGVASTPGPSRPSLVAGAADLLRDFAAVVGAQGVGALGYVLAGAVLEGLSFSLLIPLLGIIFGAAAPSGRVARAEMLLFGLFGAEAPFSRLLLLLLLFAFLMSLRAAIMSLRDVAVVSLQVRFIGALRLRLARRLAASRWEYIARLRHARITHLMGGDIQRLAIGLEFLLRGGGAAAVLLAQCILALLLAPVLAIAMLALLGLGLIALGGALTRTRALGGFAFDANLALLSGTAQFLGGLKLAMSQNLEDGFVCETGQTLRQLAERQTSFVRQQAWSRAGLTVLAALLGSALLLAGYGWLHISPAILVALSLVGTRMVGPAGQIQQGAQQFANVLPVYEKMRELEDELAAFAAEQSAPGLAYPEGPITFQHVRYRHAGEAGGANGLRDFNLTIAPGEFLGVTGASGAGKTTFADLLAGLYPPQAGQIRAGGQDLGAVLTAWRDGLSYVAQDAFLFHDTVRRNLAWANGRASEDNMWRALGLAGADDLVRRMEKGLETVVGERGTLISGGERQRIALARALLRQPRLLLMDEATSALDNETERRVLARLATLCPRPTIVLIAHRRENLDLCDRVIHIENRQGPLDDAA